MLKRSLLVGATLATVTLGGGSFAMAANSTTDSGSSLADKIATKFNLKSSDVQAVIDQDHQDRDAQRQADFKAKLAQAVKDGKLTQEQADHITGVRGEIDTLRSTGSSRDLDQSTRDQIKQKMDSLRSWATDNKIDTQYIMGLGGKGGHGRGGFDGPRDGMMPPADNSTNGSNSSSTSSSTQSN